MGDFSIEVPGQATAQDDKTYCFDQRKAVPDLAIEGVITGERETKLRRYAVLEVSEVWFWIESQIGVYCLQEDGQYTQSSNSLWLPDLNLQHLASCATIEVRADAVQAFFGGSVGQ